MSNTRRDGFAWKWNDPSHLEAHRAEFYVPPEEVLEQLYPLVAERRPSESGTGQVPFHADFEFPGVVGETGLKTVAPDGSESFWAYRVGRRIPSHLCLGTRETTRSVCLWGWWAPDAFVIHTLYPGRRAPREIHDPDIELAQLPEAIEFWRTHAIITNEDSFSRTPYGV